MIKNIKPFLSEKNLAKLRILKEVRLFLTIPKNLNKLIFFENKILSLRTTHMSFIVTRCNHNLYPIKNL